MIINTTLPEIPIFRPCSITIKFESIDEIRNLMARTFLDTNTINHSLSNTEPTLNKCIRCNLEDVEQSEQVFNELYALIEDQ